MKKITILLYILVAFGYAQDKVFPQDYFGIYKGKLEITNAKGNQEIDMEFHLNATNESGKYTYTIVYVFNGNRQERKYNLIEKDAISGAFIVDENNGILLNAQWLGNALYSMYEVQGNVLTTTERFYEDKMIFEIMMGNQNELETSGGTSEEIPEVNSYPVKVYQKAILIKEKGQ